MILVFYFAGDDIPITDDESFARKITIEESDISYISCYIMKLYLIELLGSSGELSLGDDVSDD